jgi:hypothetical protein
VNANPLLRSWSKLKVMERKQAQHNAEQYRTSSRLAAAEAASSSSSSSSPSSSSPMGEQQRRRSLPLRMFLFTIH